MAENGRREAFYEIAAYAHKSSSGHMTFYAIGALVSKNRDFLNPWERDHSSSTSSAVLQFKIFKFINLFRHEIREDEGDLDNIETINLEKLDEFELASKQSANVNYRLSCFKN